MTSKKCLITNVKVSLKITIKGWFTNCSIQRKTATAGNDSVLRNSSSNNNNSSSGIKIESANGLASNQNNDNSLNLLSMIPYTKSSSVFPHHPQLSGSVHSLLTSGSATTNSSFPNFLYNSIQNHHNLNNLNPKNLTSKTSMSLENSLRSTSDHHLLSQTNGSSKIIEVPQSIRDSIMKLTTPNIIQHQSSPQTLNVPKMYPKMESDDESLNRDSSFEDETNSFSSGHMIGADGKKARVRSVLSEETLKILRAQYETNPRPKKQEILRLAAQVNYSTRVVQVWFQNMRARDRRLGRPIPNGASNNRSQSPPFGALSSKSSPFPSPGNLHDSMISSGFHLNVPQANFIHSNSINHSKLIAPLNQILMTSSHPDMKILAPHFHPTTGFIQRSKRPYFNHHHEEDEDDAMPLDLSAKKSSDDGHEDDDDDDEDFDGDEECDEDYGNSKSIKRMKSSSSPPPHPPPPGISHSHHSKSSVINLSLQALMSAAHETSSSTTSAASNIRKQENSSVDSEKSSLTANTTETNRSGSPGSGSTRSESPTDRRRDSNLHRHDEMNNNSKKERGHDEETDRRSIGSDHDESETHSNVDYMSDSSKGPNNGNHMTRGSNNSSPPKIWRIADVGSDHSPPHAMLTIPGLNRPMIPASPSSSNDMIMMSNTSNLMMENGSRQNNASSLTSSNSPDALMDGMNYVCDQCDKTFNKQSSLARHKYEHSG